MASCASLALTIIASLATLSHADEIAWGDVSADGSLETRSLDVPVATARGADNFFIPNPMDSHDWSHTSVVRNSLTSVLSGSADKEKVKTLEETLRPIFSVLPKNAEGRLNKGTARYALHRLFSQRHGWSIKGLEPAGAAWMETLSVTPDVKDVTKYMVPSYLQQLLSDRLGVAGYDLHSLAVLAAVIDHLIHAEMISIVYSIFTTLELPIPGKRAEKEVDDIIDTFMMVYAFGINLDVSVLDDVTKAKAHLERSHSGWPQLQIFAKEAREQASLGRELDFAEIVQVVEKISEGYAQWQGKDCVRVKDELSAKPSYRDGNVQLSEVQESHATGRRSLFTENREDLEKLGVLSTSSDSKAQLIVPNYVNSQSMCLSTASLYTVCCPNECDSLLASLERGIAAPDAEPAQLAGLIKALPGAAVTDALLQELHSLPAQGSDRIPLHGRPLAGWMHRAFPLACPAPHNHAITNPKTPDEWMGESGLAVPELEEMIAEIAQVLAKYTTMGKNQTETFATDAAVSDASVDIIRHDSPLRQKAGALQSGGVIAMAFRLTAMASMLVLVFFAAKSLTQATGKPIEKCSKDFV